MKTLRKQSFFVLAAVLACTTLHAQTADEVVDKYVAALGGKAAIENVKSLYIESSAEAMGQEFPSTTWIVNGKGYKNETDVNGSKIVTCANDKGGWTVNPLAGIDKPTALPEEQLKAVKGRIDVGGPLYNYAAKGSKVELLATNAADSQYKLKLTNGSVTSTFYINKKTYYLDKAVSMVNMMGQDVEVTNGFTDYRKVDGGYVVAFGQNVVNPNMTINITHKKVEVNKPIEPTIFDMPK